MSDDFTIPIGDWVETGVRFLIEVLQPIFDVLRSIFLGMYDGIEWVLITPPWWAIIIVLAAVALVVKGWRLAVGTAAGLLLIVLVDQWDHAMETLALVIVATLIAVLISVPLGIWAARNDVVSNVVRPILDFLQTMPAFVYLIPALVLFRVGVVPGIVATIMFSLAPGVRFTELGIRGVDKEVVEAGQAFGAPPSRILRQIQLPLALPTIMTGVNQIIMLSLSMVVIAAMVGAGGLGQPIVQSLQRIDIGLGSEAGLSVVILAIFLDRVTNALGSLQDHSPVVQARNRRAMASAAPAPSPEAAAPAAENETAAPSR